MKTTIELPDELFREVKATAARRGETLKTFVSNALQEKLAVGGDAGTITRAGRPWTDIVGPLTPPLSAEDRRLFDESIEEAFEQIEPDEDV